MALLGAELGQVGPGGEAVLLQGRQGELPSLDQIWSVAASLGYQDSFVASYKHSITDDHTPFLEQAIPAIDIIDFDYPHWHTAADTADKVSPASLERVGRVLQTLLEDSAQR